MASAIKTVSYYSDGSVKTCCDRCGQGIKHVAVVTYKDGQVQRYGWDCIDKILASAPDLKGLFKKNAKLARTYREYLDILTGPVENMKRGREYFNAGLYFIADSAGKDVFFGHWFFHPVFDAEKNAAGGRYVQTDSAAFVAKAHKEIEDTLPALRRELERIEGFLARVLNKAKATANAA